MEIRDAIIRLIGGIAICAGLWFVYPPACLITGGALLIADGLLRRRG